MYLIIYPMNIYTQQDVVDNLARMVEAAGAQKYVADGYGVSPTYLNDVLAGRKPPGKTLLKAMGLRIVYTDE